MLKAFKKRTKNYILNRNRSGLQWKIGTMLITLTILAVLYSKGVIAIATINNRPVTIRELISFLRNDDPENIINSTLTEKILELEAKKRGIEVSQQETKQEMIRLINEAAENGQTVYELTQTAEEDSKELEKNIKKRIILYKIITSDQEISEEDIDKYMEENKDLYDPDQEEAIREELKYILLDQDSISEIDDTIRDANAETDIDYFIDLDNL